MSEDFDFDAIKDEATKQAKKDEEIRAANGGIEPRENKHKWTKGPFIVAGIILAVIIIALVVFLYIPI